VFHFSGHFSVFLDSTHLVPKPQKHRKSISLIKLVLLASIALAKGALKLLLKINRKNSLVDTMIHDIPLPLFAVAAIRHSTHNTYLLR
jgi:hypothetical protein